MSQAVMEALLRSDQIFIPYEELHGAKQVASIVVHVGDQYSSFSLVDDDRNFGPAGLTESGLSSSEVHDWITSPNTNSEAIAVRDIQVSKRHFLSIGEYGTAITSMVFVGVDGRIIRLSAQGSIYSYGLVLEGVSN